jgi:hypothetical protein
MFAMLATPVAASLIEPCCTGECESEEDGGGCGECSDCAHCASARAFPIEPRIVLDAPAVTIAGPFGAFAAPPAGEPREVLHVPKRT